MVLDCFCRVSFGLFIMKNYNYIFRIHYIDQSYNFRIEWYWLILNKFSVSLILILLNVCTPCNFYMKRVVYDYIKMF